MASHSAQNANRAEREHDYLSARGALTNLEVVKNEVSEQAVTCQVCGKAVHPDNLARHMLTYHSESPLETVEMEGLMHCEVVIAGGLPTFVDVGEALKHIRDHLWYKRHYGFPNFRDYCREKWGMQRAHAYRLMDAASVVANLAELPAPDNESQVRVLVSLTPEQQRLVWKVAVETAPDGKVTAAHVKSLVEVLNQLFRTGALDDGSGEDVKINELVKAVVTEETYERMKRQEQHIKQNNERVEFNAQWKKRWEFFDIIDGVLVNTNGERFKFFAATGKPFRVVIYEPID
jgi:hypothetical protein